MIEITNEGRYDISVVGHAGYAEVGKDIVCAGVTSLVGALSEYLLRNEDRCKACEITIEQGYAKINVTPKRKFKRECDAAFYAARCGFEQIQAIYPKNIKYF